MADYVLSNAADGDLAEIYAYSYQRFGEAKADAYYLGLRDAIELLADNPALGSPARYLRPGLLRHNHARHVVFYLVEDTGIFVVRILHHAMDSERHLVAENEE
ncbi:MAG: type II toxin-antitoxin system RelE/ParE family toxin [Alphaproteobacteria bacterium]|nr:type II toxin-antitoxin system RelE/ParE family toxin [Alphaproteobacteria bacterium]